jgi:hypothetical protein
VVDSGFPSPHQPQRVGFWDVLAFVCELTMVAAFAVVGWQLSSSVPLQVVLAIVLPVAAAGIWAIWMAPTSARRLANPARLVAQLGLFAVCGAALAIVGHPEWGLLVAVVSAFDFMILAWRELPRRPAPTQRTG